MAERGELVFIVDGNTSITGHCLRPEFRGSQTRAPHCQRAPVRLRVPQGKEIIKLIKMETEWGLICTFEGVERRQRVRARCRSRSPSPRPVHPRDQRALRGVAGRRLGWGNCCGGGREIRANGARTSRSHQGLKWGWPEVRQRLRRGRDLVGQREPHAPGEALGLSRKLPFGGLDACVSANTSPQFSQDLLRPRWVWPD